MYNIAIVRSVFLMDVSNYTFCIELAMSTI